MIELLKEYIRDNNLPATDRNLLLGVSGGIDSMVLLNLLTSAGYTCQVAHCNFGLRGTESDMDEQFVSEFCNISGIKFHSIRFDTKEYSKNHGISIQMAARDLRYDWFEKLRIELDLDHIYLAHNKNDVVETFIINLSRGTGINGLTGIRPVNGRIIRPLLFATREMIEHFAMENKIEFREDSSNSEIKYLRNRVRHLILPQFEKIQNDSVSSINETIEKLSDASVIFNDTIASIRAKLITAHDDYDAMDKDDLKNLFPINTYLFELFRCYGVTPQQVVEIKTLLYSDTGKMVLTRMYRIISDRNRILIAPLADQDNILLFIENEDQLLNYNELFKVTRVTRDVFNPVKGGKKVWLDGDKLVYPLTIRSLEKGDSFHPFGMNGNKKLSDLLIDYKIPIHQKESVMVLQSADMIVWVIGIRADNRFRITDKSTNIIELSPLE